MARGFLAVAITLTPSLADFNCEPFGCSCQGFADWYGASTGRTWGCADRAAKLWWKGQGCEGPQVPKIDASLAPGVRRGGCTSTCISDTSAGYHHSIPCSALWSGFTVNYNVPSKCLTSSCGLIVDVHGFSMTGGAEDLNSNMKAIGEEHGFIVVQPNAPLNNWNVNPTGGVCSGILTPNATPGNQTCFEAPWDKEPMSDRAINSWVQEALEVKAWNVDKNRVHLMGFSEGGWMTSRMLCTYTDLYASFSALAPASNADPFECIQPGAEHPPILITQGYNDMSSTWRIFNDGWEKLKQKYKLDEGKLINGTTTCGQQWETFDCNDFGCTCQGFADFYGVTYKKTLGCAEGYKVREAWHAEHSCTASAQSDAHPGCTGCFSRTKHLGPANVPVELLTYDYIADYFLRGHCFPGSDNLERVGKEIAAFACPGSKEIAQGAKSPFHWGLETINFFLQHPKASVQTV